MSTARSDEEVANAVGILLGEIPPIIVVIATDTSKFAKVFRERVPDLRQQFLRKHHWNFAMDRKRLVPTYQVITNAVDAAGKVRITVAAHGRATGDRITVDQVNGVPGANGSYYITVIDVNTMELDDSTFSGAYVSGGRVASAAQFDYSYRIALPPNFIKLVAVVDDPEYKVEGRFIISNASTLYIKYVWDVVAYTDWDTSAYMAFQHFLAIALVETITASTDRKESLIEEFKDIMAKAKNQDATEDPHTRTDDQWLHDLRSGSNFVRDPLT